MKKGRDSCGCGVREAPKHGGGIRNFKGYLHNSLGKHKDEDYLSVCCNILCLVVKQIRMVLLEYN